MELYAQAVARNAKSLEGRKFVWHQDPSRRELVPVIERPGQVILSVKRFPRLEQNIGRAPRLCHESRPIGKAPDAGRVRCQDDMQIGEPLSNDASEFDTVHSAGEFHIGEDYR